MMFGLPHDTKRLWNKEDLITEMDADPKRVAHWNLILSHTFAIKEPGFAEYNPNNTINREADNVVRQVYNGRDENAIIMLGRFDIEAARSDLSSEGFNTLENYINANLVGRGLWDYTTLSSHEDGRKGRFQNGWSDADLKAYFDEQYGFDLKRFKTDDSLPTQIWRVHIPAKVGKTQADHWRKTLLRYEGKAGAAQRAQLTHRENALGHALTPTTRAGKTGLAEAMNQLQRANAAQMATATAAIHSYQDRRSETSAASSNQKRPKSSSLTSEDFVKAISLKLVSTMRQQMRH
jgi:hypothetical protein